MLIKRAIFPGEVTALIALMVACSVEGQGYLINGSTRNGSFESGVSSPWGGIDAVMMTAGFASDGEWFGQVQSTRRTSSWQNLSVNPLQGREFVVQVDARIGMPGFDTVSGYINAWNADGTYVSPQFTVVSSPPLSANAWGHCEWRFAFPSTMDGTQVRLGLDMSGGDGISTYVGYFDDVVLEQVPEPSVHSLILTALGVTMCWRRHWLPKRR